jgi:hypothetical protein
MERRENIQPRTRDNRTPRQSQRIAASLLFLTIAVSACGSNATAPSPSVPNQPQVTLPVPQPSPVAQPLPPTPPQEYVVVFRVLDAQSGAAITNVSVTVLDGPKAGTTSTTISDQLSVQLPAGLITVSVSADGHQPVERQINVAASMVVEVQSQRIPPRRLYWGTVRDGRGQPLAGATLIFCGDTLITNAAGYYEEYTYSNSCNVTVTYPGVGYLSAGGVVYNGERDFTLRRVVSVTLLYVPATMLVGQHSGALRVLVTLDDGTQQTNYLDLLQVDSPTVINTKNGSDGEFIVALSPGTGTIFGYRYQVASAKVTIQVKAP